MMLSGWGQFPRVETELWATENTRETRDLIATLPTLISRGNGRSYGDAALGVSNTLDMRRMDRLIDFNAHTGILTCESGVMLSDILAIFVPRGWFPAVTPGTKFVTIGGMVAANVHGKNHHCHGAFGDHVKKIQIALGDGSVVSCSCNEHADLFFATLGGLGLTGTILSVSFRLIPIETAWIKQEIVQVPSLTEAMAFFEHSASWPYTVAWIDCLLSGAAMGRSVCFRGRHATLSELPAHIDPFSVPAKKTINVPVDLPISAVNSFSVRALNEAYYNTHTNSHGLVDYESFFYPLDTILNWNRIYGKKGFYQYQCVLPKTAAADGIKQILSLTSNMGCGSFLAVLKLLGPGAPGSPLSFPMEGFTLSLDFPVVPKMQSLFKELDQIIVNCGGRLYLAKDARMPSEMLTACYPDLDDFRAVRKRWKAVGKFESVLSRRLKI